MVGLFALDEPFMGSVAATKNEHTGVKAWVIPDPSPSVRNAPRYVSVGLFSILLGLGISNSSLAADGFASYYTARSCAKEAQDYNLSGNYWGATTANGEAYDEGALTCALRRRDFGKSYMVYGHKTGKSVIVRHNDFGPGKKPTARGVIVDLTPRAFKAVCGDLKMGRCEVSVQEVK